MWQTHQEEAFQIVKTMIIKALVLKLYDLNKEAIIQADTTERAGILPFYIKGN